jgi:hypothetical protein
VKPPQESIAVSVEVAVTDVLQGIGEINGLLSCGDEALIFSYQKKNMLGMSGEEEVLHISYQEIQDAVYKNNLFLAKLTLRPKRLRVMEEMPGSSREKMVFTVKREDRKRADKLVAYIKYKLYEAYADEVDSIPFQLADTGMGLREHSGLLYLDDEFLVFEVQSGITGGRKDDQQVIKIEPSALVSMRLEQGLVKDTLYVQPKKETLLSVMPGNYKDTLKLSIAKRYREAAENLVQRVAHRAADPATLPGEGE